MKPTLRQRKLLTFITKYVADRGTPPTLREMAEHMRLRSLSGIRQHLQALVRQGYLEVRPGLSRSAVPTASALRLLALDPGGVPLPPLNSTSQTGEEATADLAETDPLWKELAGSADPGEFACFRVTDDAMAGDGIFQGDMVLAQRMNTAQNGDLVALRIEDRILIRRLVYKDNQALLVPSKDGYASIHLPAGAEPKPVQGLVRSFNQK